MIGIHQSFMWTQAVVMKSFLFLALDLKFISIHIQLKFSPINSTLFRLVVKTWKWKLKSINWDENSEGVIQLIWFKGCITGCLKIFESKKKECNLSKEICSFIQYDLPQQYTYNWFTTSIDENKLFQVSKEIVVAKSKGVRSNAYFNSLNFSNFILKLLVWEDELSWWKIFFFSLNQVSSRMFQFNRSQFIQSWMFNLFQDNQSIKFLLHLKTLMP